MRIIAMMERNFGGLLIGFGLAAVVIGILVSTGAMSWFGNLRGDLRFGSGRTHAFVPLASMLLVSLVLSAVLTLLSWWRR